ncbi:MAG: hypothetical protein R3293_11900 [Candidatus Promineifilaceae bacterium]|nr:hypothetical protein [Candidatus Promineifilaceae bacterium]
MSMGIATGGMRKWLSGLAIVVILCAQWLVVAPPSAYACSCMVPPPPQEAMAEATAVFSGQVTDVEISEGETVSSADPVRATFAVDQVWKGAVDDIVTVGTPLSSASCGVNFEEGKEYVVYAYGGADELTTNLCSRTAEMTPELEDLAALGAGTAPEAGTGGASDLANGMPAWMIYVLLALLAAGAAAAVIVLWRRGSNKNKVSS